MLNNHERWFYTENEARAFIGELEKEGIDNYYLHTNRQNLTIIRYFVCWYE